MCCSLLFLICMFGLTIKSYGQPSSKLEATFAGENIFCDGLSARVNVNDQTVRVEEEAIVQAVATAFANALQSSEAAKSEASSIGFKVLEVTARAVATVEAFINSPFPGCWAVAFGKAQAQAIAKAVVNSIAQAAAIALKDNAQASAIVQAEVREQSVAEAVATVAILLAAGDGSGAQSGKGVATAKAKAIVVGCAIAKGMAEVYKDDKAAAEAIVQAGCQGQFPELLPVGALAMFDGCACQKYSSSGAPSGCGNWGGADQFCYVTSPQSCPCAQDSDIYSGQKWRFCGSTLDTMKAWLDFDDETQGIARAMGEYGYCP